MGIISRIKTWITGDILVASDINGEFNNILNDYNGSINEDNIGTITGTITWSTSANVDLISLTKSGTGVGSLIDGSNAGTDPSIDIDNTSTGDILLLKSSGNSVFQMLSTGEISFANIRSPGFSSNLKIEADTTTNANDSIKITSNEGTELSSTNPGYITILDTSGNVDVYRVTADVTIDLTGAHFAIGGTGDLTDAILRVFAINDNNATLRWGVAYQGGREVIASTSTSATATDINLPEEILVNSTLTSGTWAIQEFGYFRASFDDADGAAADLWAVQTGVGDVSLGSADGLWQDWNPTFAGFSADPVVTFARWTSYRNTVSIQLLTASGTSDALTFTIVIPIKSKKNTLNTWTNGADNSSNLSTNGMLQNGTGTSVLAAFKNHAVGTWTVSGTKRVSFNISYEAKES